VIDKSKKPRRRTKAAAPAKPEQARVRKRRDGSAQKSPPETAGEPQPAKRRTRVSGRNGLETIGRRIGRSRFAERSIAWMMRFLFDWSRMVGRRDAYAAAGSVTRLVGPFVREHKLAEQNLAAAFPEKSPAERKKILSAMWEHFGRLAIEYAFLEDLVASFDSERPGKIKFIGLEHVRRIRETGKPVIIFGAHIGNWELVAAIGAKIGVPVTALYRPPTNPHIAAEIERRRSFVRKLVVSGDGAARQVANALRRGEHLAIVCDQRIGDGQVIDFFGRPALSNPIVGVLARLFDCPVHGCHGLRYPDGSFVIELTPPLDLPRDAAGRVDTDAANIMVHGVIEGWVRADPEQWLWLHDRWKM
jgi:KDO2-lipid IV(A) lauroyltransferase